MGDGTGCVPSSAEAPESPARRPHRFWDPRRTRSLGARGLDPKQHIKHTHGPELHSTDTRESGDRARRAPAQGTRSSTRGPVNSEAAPEGSADAPRADRTRRNLRRQRHPRAGRAAFQCSCVGQVRFFRGVLIFFLYQKRKKSPKSTEAAERGGAGARVRARITCLRSRRVRLWPLRMRQSMRAAILVSIQSRRKPW